MNILAAIKSSDFLFSLHLLNLLNLNISGFTGTILNNLAMVTLSKFTVGMFIFHLVPRNLIMILKLDENLGGLDYLLPKF